MKQGIRIVLMLIVILSFTAFSSGKKMSKKDSFISFTSVVEVKNNKIDDFKPRNTGSMNIEKLHENDELNGDIVLKKLLRSTDPTEKKEEVATYTDATKVDKDFVKFESKVVRNVVDIEKAVAAKGKSKGRKEVFFETLIPYIEEVHKEIKNEKIKVESLAKKTEYTTEEQSFMDLMFNKYNVPSKNIEELKSKLVVIPTSLVLAQASLESGWGRSTVAKGANNLFGMKSWSKDSVKSFKVGSKTYYRRYASIRESVHDYMLNLAKHRAYSGLRKAIGSGNNGSLELTKHLNNYSTLREAYGKKVGVIIRVNNLLEYDA